MSAEQVSEFCSKIYGQICSEVRLAMAGTLTARTAIVPSLLRHRIRTPSMMPSAVLAHCLFYAATDKVHIGSVRS